ncbi:MAG: DCC1-like thiol-disulfide oxidoreductase family protein [Oceanicaulis sp.]
MNLTGAAFPADKLILVMDAECALCSWGARTIAAHDERDLFRIAPMQSALGRALLIENRLDPDDPDSWLLLKDGEAMIGARAVIAAGRRLAFPWRAFAWLGACAPGPLREPVYRFVARNRIKWFGKGDLCALPDPELKRRLLDLP